MSPTPVTFSSPTAPASYTWEATDEEVAARYGVDPCDDRPLRPQHLPDPAGARRAAAGGRPLRDAALRVPAVRLPPARRGGRGALRRRAGARSSSGPGPTRSSTSSRKAFLPPGGRAVIPTPTLRDVPGHHRTARRAVVAVPRLGADGGLGARPAGRPRRRGPRRRRRLAVQPEQPDGPRRSPTAPIAGLLDGLAADAAAAGRRPRSSSSTRPTPSSSARSLLGLRERLSEPHRRPDREQGLCAGRPAGRVRDRPSRDRSPGSNPYRPPGSVSTVSVTLVTEALARPDDPRANLARVERERDRLARRPVEASAGPSDRRSRTSSSSTSARRSAPSRRRGAPPPRARAADVRRGPPARRPPAPDRPRRATRTTGSSPPPSRSRRSARMTTPARRHRDRAPARGVA